MNTIFDYIEWRGDINMTHDPINDVDILILCRLSYIPFDNVVPSSIDEGSVQIKEAAIKVLELENNGLKQFRKEEDKKLLEALIDSERFKHIPLYYYVDIFSEESEEQFSAITMMLEDGTIAVIYRGTDGTLVGWKEDFNMSFSPEVPAQQDAITYFTQVQTVFQRRNFGSLAIQKVVILQCMPLLSADSISRKESLLFVISMVLVSMNIRHLKKILVVSQMLLLPTFQNLQ